MGALGRLSCLGYGAFRQARNLCAALVLALALPAQADEVVIAALGDSLTQGYGLAAEDGFVPQLQGWLDRADAGARLINAGVSGDTTAGGLARIGWTLTDEVDGLIVALGGNDVLRGIDPATARANLDGILAEARGRGLPVLLVGIAVPPNYGPAYQAEFTALYPDLAARHGAALYPDFLAPITGEDRQVALATLMQPDGIHPNAAGVARIVEAMGPAVQDLVRAAK